MNDRLLHWKRKCSEAGAQGIANGVSGAPVVVSGSSFTGSHHPRGFRKKVLPVSSMSCSPCLPWQLPWRPGFQLRTSHFPLCGPCFPHLHKSGPCLGSLQVQSQVEAEITFKEM